MAARDTKKWSLVPEATPIILKQYSTVHREGFATKTNN